MPRAKKTKTTPDYTAGKPPLMPLWRYELERTLNKMGIKVKDDPDGDNGYFESSAENRDTHSFKGPRGGVAKDGYFTVNFEVSDKDVWKAMQED